MHLTNTTTLNKFVFMSALMFMSKYSGNKLHNQMTVVNHHSTDMDCMFLSVLNEYKGVYCTACKPTDDTDTSHQTRYLTVQGAANKSNPLPCFANISTTNRNFYTKIYTTI